jgi:hypothetical protein
MYVCMCVCVCVCVCKKCYVHAEHTDSLCLSVGNHLKL